MFLVEILLVVVNREERIAPAERGIGPELSLSGSGCRKLHVTPTLGAMHVDDPLRGPHPVVLARPGDLRIFAVFDFVLPFDAGEVDSPLVAVARRTRPMREFPQGVPRDCDFDRPALVPVRGIVERSCDTNRRDEAGNLPIVVGTAAILVGPREKEIPAGVE